MKTESLLCRSNGFLTNFFVFSRFLRFEFAQCSWLQFIFHKILVCEIKLKRGNGGELNCEESYYRKQSGLNIHSLRSSHHTGVKNIKKQGKLFRKVYTFLKILAFVLSSKIHSTFNKNIVVVLRIF